MSELDLNVSQLPGLSLPVQATDLLHVVRGGQDYKVTKSNLIVAFLSGLQDVDISAPANLAVLKYDSSSERWKPGSISWTEIASKPATFTPSAHLHTWAEITDTPSTFPPGPHAHPWSDLTGVPATFPPDVHTHDWSALTGVPNAFTPASHTHLWAEITDKPSLFPPEPHEHGVLYYDKAELSESGAGGQVHWNNITNKPSLGIGDMLTTEYDPDQDGIVSRANVADAVAWTAVTGKPSTFTPSAHTHLWADLTDKPAAFPPDVHSHAWSEITGKPTEFTPGAHVHLWADLTDKPTAFTPLAHDHDDRYFTESEMSVSGGGASIHWDNITNKPALGDASMAIADYDPDEDGAVNDSDKVAGVAPTSAGLAILSAASDTDQRTALGLGTSAVLDAGSANGVATLDAAGKVPISQLPSSIMEYKGTWNATTNSPTLIDGTGDIGDVYRVSVPGTVDLGSGSLTFDVGDYAIYNGSTWERSDSTDITEHGSLVGLTDDDHPQYVKNFAIQIVIGNGVEAITPGVFGDIEVPSDGVIEGWTMLEGTGTSGSIVVDVWKDTYANFPPTVADTITGSDKPTISSAAKGQNLSLTGWGSTSIARGQILRFNVDSSTSVKQVTLSLRCRRT